MSRNFFYISSVFKFKARVINVVCLLLFCLNLYSQSKADSTDIKKHRNSISGKVNDDIIHTILSVKPDFVKSRLYGEALIVFKSGSDVDKLCLNATNMKVQSVKIADLLQLKDSAIEKNKLENYLNKNVVNSIYAYANDTLKITYYKKAGHKYVVKVVYETNNKPLVKTDSSNRTSNAGLHFINPSASDSSRVQQCWTHGEPTGSSGWFPTIESISEKMTHEIFITVNDKYTTLSNGLLVNTEYKNGIKTDHWKMEQPNPVYLIMMVIGKFKKVNDIPWNKTEISYYSSEKYSADLKHIFFNTPE